MPDLTFQGSTAATPQVTMTMYGMNGSGSGFNTEASKAVARTSTAVIEQFTNIIYTRIRGRQMIIEISSDGLARLGNLVHRELILGRMGGDEFYKSSCFT